MSDHANLIGKALYLEFRKGVNTAQIVITPEGFDKEGNYVPVTTWRRQISTWSPKKPWKNYVAPSEATLAERKEQNVGKVVALPDSIDPQPMAQEMIVALTNTLNNLHNNKWELYKAPIVLEFSMEDLLNTKEWETPSALVRRIMRARKELGFPDELLNENAE
jgi:hypothetical protein